MVTEDQARVVKEKVKRQYWQQKPWGTYIFGVGISSLGRYAKPCPADLEHEPCVAVSVHRRLPHHLALPKEIDGVKIFVRVEEMPRLQST